MVKWLCDGGADITKVKIRYYGPNYRAIHAAKDIAKKSIVLSIPRRYILSIDVVEATEASKLINAKLRSKLN